MHAVQYGRNDRRSRRLRSRGGNGVLSRFAASAFVLWALVLLAGCAGEVATHGDLVQDDKLSQIIPLQHGQRDVLGVLGSPSTVSVMDGEAWYYIGDIRINVFTGFSYCGLAFLGLLLSLQFFLFLLISNLLSFKFFVRIK